MRGNAELEAWGAQALRARGRRLRRLGPHPLGARGRRSVTSTGCTRCRPASTWTSSRRRPRAEALAGAARGVPRRPAEPRQPPGAASRRGKRRAARRVPRRRLRRPSSTSGSSSTTRASTSCSRRSAAIDARTRRSSASATTGASWSGWRPRGRSSPARSSTATSSHLIPLADVAVVPSIFPEAFGMVAAEAAAAGCPPLVARHSGLEEIAIGLEEAYPASPAVAGELRDRRLPRPRNQAPRPARPAPRAPPRPRRGRPAGSGRKVVVGERRGEAPRAVPILVTVCYLPSKGPARSAVPAAPEFVTVCYLGFRALRIRFRFNG